MPQESGNVNPYLEPIVGILFAGGAPQEVIVDTAFDGALVLPRSVAELLGFVVVGSEEVKLAAGKAEMQAALAKVRWLGEERDAEVLISEDSDSLLGTELLKGTCLTIDYVALTVSIDC
jgi:clan AA aspartic protease